MTSSLRNPVALAGGGHPSHLYSETLPLPVKLLRLVSSVCAVIGMFYGGYFYQAGMRMESLVGILLTLLAVTARVYAHLSGQSRRALDGLNATVFIVVACVALFQDGIHSPALHWLIAPLCISLLTRSNRLAATLFTLALLETVLLAFHGPGSWGPFSLLAPAMYQQTATALALSTITVGLIVGASARWTFDLRRTLELAREAALAAAAAQARFVSHLSHELRTPLQGLVGASDILKANHLARTQREQLLAVQSQSVKSVLEMLNAVLDFSKLEASKMVLNVTEVDLRSLVFEINEQFAVPAFSKGLELTSSCAPALPSLVRGDAIRIRQVVSNLVSNAVKFTAAGGVHIHVAAELAGDGSDQAAWRISIEVQDTGDGMDPGGLDTLFKPFHQGDETIASRYGGTGLGLSISKSLAELMGGRIEVATVRGTGTAFTLVLDLREQAAVTRATPRYRDTALVATSSLGLLRHLSSRLEELGVCVTASQGIPDDEHIRRLGAKLVLVDAGLLQDDPTEAARQLGLWSAIGATVVTVSPLIGEPNADVSSGGAQIFQPVSRQALAALLDEPPGATIPTVTVSATSTPLHTQSRPVVLVAEDDPVNQVVVGGMLTSCAIDVVTVADGQAALDVLKRQRVGLVLTDIRMPGMDGLVLVRALRHWERVTGTTRTPVIAITGHYESEQIDACLQAGMDDVLVKPFRLEELRRKLRPHLALET